MNVEIVPATIDDAVALAAIQQQAFKRLYDIYHDEGSPYLRGADEIVMWLDRPNVSVYRILADGILCGGVSFCERNNLPGEYYLARIYILPKLQGKGIASTAILLCEATVTNASHWTLDFPVNEIANRRCYEKAGYMDTVERGEQSGGTITLAYMEKTIPAFRSIKKQLDDPDIIKLMSLSVYKYSLERAALNAQSYMKNEAHESYGWVENDDVLGVVGVLIHQDKIEITNISVAENSRKHGVGRAMITALREKYRKIIEAETDDDAIDFYRKCGFETVAIYKQYGNERFRRWICIMSVESSQSSL